MLVFCRDQHWLEKLPLPKDEAAKVRESAEADSAAEGEQTAASAE
jgi:hypothetical protein